MVLAGEDGFWPRTGGVHGCSALGAWDEGGWCDVGGLGGLVVDVVDGGGDVLPVVIGDVRVPVVEAQVDFMVPVGGLLESPVGLEDRCHICVEGLQHGGMRPCEIQNGVWHGRFGAGDTASARGGVGGWFPP